MTTPLTCLLLVMRSPPRRPTPSDPPRPPLAYSALLAFAFPLGWADRLSS